MTDTWAWSEARLPKTIEERSRDREEKRDWRLRVPGASKSKSPPAEVRNSGLCGKITERDKLEAFFKPDAASRHEAKATCWSCPVRRECLEWALSTLQIWGVWGGCDEHELRRTLSVDAHGNWKLRSRGVRCPYCSSWDLSSSLTHVSCDECELAWPRVPKPRQRRRVTIAITDMETPLQD